MAEKSRRRRVSAAPTIADVAKAAGVSPMTVSRVINRDRHVRASTRDRVKTAMGALNYAPNAAARTLAGGTQTRIGLIYGNPSAAYLSEVLLGGLEEAGQSDVQLVLERTDRVECDKIVRRLAAQRLHGVILPPPFSDSKMLISALRAARIPVVLMATPTAPKGVSVVAIDDAEAAREMTAHLLSLGHTRIAFITGAADQAASARRLEGYRRGLESAGLTFNRKLVVGGDFTYRKGEIAAKKLLRLKERPTAIFASNDDMAAGAIAAAHALQLDVPNDVSIVGFDDTLLATTISPALTTIRQPISEMAKAAVSMLTAVRRAGDSISSSSSQQVLFAHRLIRRGSDVPI